MKHITWILTTASLVIILCALAWAIRPQIGTAIETYLGYVHSRYPAMVGSRIDNCKLCHPNQAGGPYMNNYGWDWRDMRQSLDPVAALAAIEGIDSDNDGYSNIAEITAWTFPGDPNDYPQVTPTSTSQPSATPTASATRTSVPTWTSTPTRTNTPIATNTPIHTSTPTRTPTSTGIPTQTPTSNTPTPTATLPAYTGRLLGTVRLEGRTNHSGATVSILGLQTVTGTDGRYTMENVPAGVWSATASHSGYLSAIRFSVAIADGQDTLVPEVTLRSGDPNGDCIVDLFDLVLISTVYNPDGPVSDLRADLNTDGTVNLLDLVLVSTNYGLRCPQIW